MQESCIHLKRSEKGLEGFNTKSSKLVTTIATHFKPSTTLSI